MKSTAVAPSFDKRPVKKGPRRPRSAYNLFFRDEQAKLRAIKSKQQRRGAGGVKAESSVRVVANMWNNVDATTKAHYMELARQDKQRYALEVVEWKQKQEIGQNYNLEEDAWDSQGVSERHSGIKFMSGKKDTLFTGVVNSPANHGDIVGLQSQSFESQGHYNDTVISSMSDVVHSSDLYSAPGHRDENDLKKPCNIASPQESSPNVFQDNQVAAPPYLSVTSCRSWGPADRLQDPESLKNLAMELGNDGVDMIVRLFGRGHY